MFAQVGLQVREQHRRSDHIDPPPVFELLQKHHYGQILDFSHGSKGCPLA